MYLQQAAAVMGESLLRMGTIQVLLSSKVLWLILNRSGTHSTFSAFPPSKKYLWWHSFNLSWHTTDRTSLLYSNYVPEQFLHARLRGACWHHRSFNLWDVASPYQAWKYGMEYMKFMKWLNHWRLLHWIMNMNLPLWACCFI